MKKVCVLMSTYNGEQFVNEQIESILNQIEVDIHIIIRDDGSVDNTVNIIKAFNDPRITLVEGKNIGWKKSFSELLRMAPVYEYYAFSDQDDVWERDKLVSGVNKIKNADLPALYYCDATVVDEQLCRIGEKINMDPFDEKLSNLFVCVGQGCCMVLNLAAKQLFSQYRPNADFSHEAWLCVLCAYFGIIIHDRKQYINYRVTGNNTSGYGKTKKTALFINFWRKEFRKKIYPPYALELVNGYKSMLSKEEILELETVIHYKNSLENKKKLILSSKVHRQSLIGTMALKFAILFNLY